MIDHRAWVDHLKSACPVLENRVFDVAQFTRDAGAWKSLPSAYVYPFQDQAGTEYQPLQARQSITVTMAIIIVTRQTGTSEVKLDTLSSVRSAINAALLGWIPPGCFDSITYVGGQSEEFVNTDFIWEDRYMTRYLLTP